MYVLGNYKIYPWKSSEKKTLLPKSAAKVQQIFEMCKILNEIIHLCLHMEVTSVKRLPFAQQCGRTFEGVPIHGGGGRKYYNLSTCARFYANKK